MENQRRYDVELLKLYYQVFQKTPCLSSSHISTMGWRELASFTTIKNNKGEL